jgi:hypothetical protein
VGLMPHPRKRTKHQRGHWDNSVVPRRWVAAPPAPARLAGTAAQRNGQSKQRTRLRYAVAVDGGELPAEARLRQAPAGWAALADRPWDSSVPSQVEHQGRQITLETMSITGGKGPLAHLPVAAVATFDAGLQRAIEEVVAQVPLMSHIAATRRGKGKQHDCVGKTAGGAPYTALHCPPHPSPLRLTTARCVAAARCVAVNIGIRVGQKGEAIIHECPPCLQRLVAEGCKQGRRMVEERCGAKVVVALRQRVGLLDGYSLDGEGIFTGAFLSYGITDPHIDSDDVEGSLTFVIPLTVRSLAFSCVFSSLGRLLLLRRGRTASWSCTHRGRPALKLRANKRRAPSPTASPAGSQQSVCVYHNSLRVSCATPVLTLGCCCRAHCTVAHSSHHRTVRQRRLASGALFRRYLMVGG